jgi:hypothetical protein
MVHPEANTTYTKGREITLQCDKERRQKNVLLPQENQWKEQSHRQEWGTAL